MKSSDTPTIIDLVTTAVATHREALNEAALPVYNAAFELGERKGSEEATRRMAEESARGLYDLAGGLIRWAIELADSGDLRAGRAIAQFARNALGRTPDSRARDVARHVDEALKPPVNVETAALRAALDELAPITADLPYRR